MAATLVRALAAGMLQTTMHPERRRVARDRLIMRGEVRAGDARPPMRCTTLNYSPQGVGVLLPQTTALPTFLHLRLPAKRTDLLAKIIWQQDDQVGLAVVGPPAANDRTPDDGHVFRKLESLEQDIEAMRRELKALRLHLTGTRGEPA